MYFDINVVKFNTKADTECPVEVWHKHVWIQHGDGRRTVKLVCGKLSKEVTIDTRWCSRSDLIKQVDTIQNEIDELHRRAVVHSMNCVQRFLCWAQWVRQKAHHSYAAWVAGRGMR